MDSQTTYHQSHKGFTGPIFIVGMPRSGTKLLRTLLNNHSMIGITVNESGCLPYFHHIFDRFQPIQKPNNFNRFYTKFSNTTFFRRLTREHKFIDEEKWFSLVDVWDYPGVIEAFYRCYAASLDKTLWGDKTPSYMLEMPLLKSLFPDAKFIHIIRDVRDYCISINKAWNKNIFRAAQRWNDSISKCRSDAKSIPASDYLEVQFEQLVSSPDVVLPKVCKNLGLTFEETMIELQQPSENLGDARGAAEIKKDNFGKWTILKKSKTDKIESICMPLLSDLGYPVQSHHQQGYRLGLPELIFYKFLDAVNFLLFEIKTNKIEGIRNFVRSRRIAWKL